MTEAERRVWFHLRAHRFHGTGFRRQVPIGRYVVDFVCFEHRLVVETDGDSHGSDAQRRRDEARTRFLQSAGYRFVRFWNRDVYENMEAVLQGIGIALGLYHPEFPDTPLPNPPPQGGRGHE